MTAFPFVATSDHLPRNRVMHGDCIPLMAALPEGSVDFILADPPYGVNYRSRSGERVANDNSTDWMPAAFAGMYRALKPGGLCATFYGWGQAEPLLAACRAAGFRIAGHLVFAKRYASSTGFLGHAHECAYLLAKGQAERPDHPIPDVIAFPYTGNRLHPTQKPVAALRPLIESFTQPGEIVLDPFCGSGSTLVAAQMLGRDWIGMELSASHCHTARRRMR